MLVLKKLTPNEVERILRFKDLFLALSFVVVTRIGNIDTACSTVKGITWLEEWMMYLDFFHDHSLKRWKDVTSKSG